jgi:hypothetical protein
MIFHTQKFLIIVLKISIVILLKFIICVRSATVIAHTGHQKIYLHHCIHDMLLNNIWKLLMFTTKGHFSPYRTHIILSKSRFYILDTKKYTTPFFSQALCYRV